VANEVAAKVEAALLEPGLGRLVPENLGIGKPLFRSAIFETVLQVPGTRAVRWLGLNGADFSDYARAPSSGAYFDFQGRISVGVDQ
jgi:hypothetical protein